MSESRTRTGKNTTGHGSGNGSAGRSGRSGGVDHLEVIRFRPQQSWPVQAALLLWRWLVELLLLSGVLYVVVRLCQAGMDYIQAVLAVVVVLVAPLVVPAARRVVFAAGWVLVTRHRLRTYFVQCRIFNRSGRLPWIVWIIPTPVGERLWLWLVPGLSVDHFTASTELLTAACWARTARVERHTGNGALVRVDIVRRDPLTKGGFLPSVLIPATHRGVDPAAAADAGAPLDLPVHVIDLTEPDTTTAPAPGSGSGRSSHQGIKNGGRSSNQGAATPAPGTPQRPSPPLVTARSGEDVSDYV